MNRLGRLFERFRPARRDGQGPEAVALRWAVVGLGNPGEAYRHTRHNLGFMVVDYLAEKLPIELSRRKFKGVFSETRGLAQPAVLARAHTFYNASGEFVAPLLGYFRIPAQRLIVVHDDLDLPACQLRLKRGGGDAGNRGVRSITEALGDPEFVRVRIGIGRPNEDEDSVEYVLRAMGRAELESFRPAIARAAEAVQGVIGEGLERAMNRYNQRA